MTRRLVAPLVLVLVSSLVFFKDPASAAMTLVVDDDGMATAADCNDPTPTYMTIGAAVAAAASGDTIKVCPGMYTENVVLNKSLTLLGAQAGVDARGRVSANESVVASAPVAGTRTLELRTGSAGSIIDGFTFGAPLLGGYRAIESTTGPINDLQLLNNRIQLFNNAGVFLNDNGINITVNQNDIDGTVKVGSGDLFHLDQDNFDGFWFTNNRVVNGATASGFFVDGSRNVDKGTAGSRTPMFTGNFIDRNQTGANLGRLAWGDGPITGNTFSNNGSDGLQGGPKKALIAMNTFDRNGRNGLTLTSFGNTTDPARGAQDNTIEHNCFTGNGFAAAGAGIFFSATQFPGTIATNVAHQNNITGNAMGARYPLPGTETIHAENNWWGAANGPGPPDGTGSGDGVDGHGKIIFVPYRGTPAGGTPCSAGPPATLTLAPVTATNPVDTEHCVTATVEDSAGNPVPDVIVRFSVTGSVNTTGSVTTDANGEAKFCYMGPSLPGADAIHAYADSNGDNVQGAPPPAGDEPFGDAAKVWTPPTSTPFCEVQITNGGWIYATNGDRANFGGNANVDKDGNPTGQEEYQDQGPVQPMNVHSTKITATTCTDDRMFASIFGESTIDGSGTFIFRIDVTDMGSPSTNDKYEIRLSNGYDSGNQLLQGGNVTIH